jgi:hypothetical protein
VDATTNNLLTRGQVIARTGGDIEATFWQLISRDDNDDPPRRTRIDKRAERFWNEVLLKADFFLLLLRLQFVCGMITCQRSIQLFRKSLRRWGFFLFIVGSNS